jgi:hypothetical protein
VLQKQGAKGSDSGRVGVDSKTAGHCDKKTFPNCYEQARQAYNAAVLEFKIEIPA